MAGWTRVFRYSPSIRGGNSTGAGATEERREWQIVSLYESFLLLLFESEQIW